MIILYIIDPFLWNSILSIKGAGPKGPANTALSEVGLAPKVAVLWNRPLYKDRALALAAYISGEDYTEALYTFVTGLKMGGGQA